MIPVVVLLVALAALQGIYNLLREAHHDFDLVDPIDLAPEDAPPEPIPRERAA